MMTNDRQLLIGSFVTQEVKDALQEAAKREGLSVSLYLFKLLREKFEREKDVAA